MCAVVTPRGGPHPAVLTVLTGDGLALAACRRHAKYIRAHTASYAAFADSVLPVIEAGRAELVEMDKTIHRHLDDSLWLEPAPGHTPGHVTVHAKGRNGSAVLCGDVIHHPIQFHEPQLSNNGDLDPVQAIASRNRMLQQCVASHAVLLTGHFPAPTSGYVTEDGDGFRFRFKSD